jgi:predicted alpha/beta superfamily hydrolase
MIKSALILLQLFLSIVLTAQHTIRINIDNLPAEPRGYDLYIAGSFNNWNPANEEFMFQRKGNGQFYIDLKLVAGNYEYKITRGSWKEVECKAGGVEKENRVLQISKDETISISIAAWKDNFSAKEIRHTATSNVKIIDTAFYIPQLKRKRKISIYLPENYVASKNRYPVMYMHDGQNVFDEATSFAGEWGVDEFLDSAMVKQCIVVAIDNGGDKRMNEYSPYDFTLDSKIVKGNKGEGQKYVDFLAKILKPFIDKNYRTLKESKNTFITGASMGGLISLYAVLKYPKVFGGAGVFSPSVWICKEDILKLIRANGKKAKSKIYFYCGKLEGEDMVPDMLLVFQELAAVSKAKMITVIRDDGKHNEPTWRKEFPLFYEWILE